MRIKYFSCPVNISVGDKVAYMLLLTVATDIAGRFLYRINQIVTSYICIHMYHIVKVKENSNYSRKDKYYTNQYVQIYFEREQKRV